MAPNSVVLETALITFPPEEDAGLESIWSEVEEPLPIDVRRRLEENGFWCGLADQQLPSALRRRLDAPAEAEAGGALPTGASAQRIQCRTGRRKPLACAPAAGELHVLLREADGMLRGRTYLQASSLVAVRCFPAGDGSVRVQVTPEIEHGETKPRHHGEGGAWQVRVGQDREIFAELGAELVLSPGQTMLLSCTPDRKGLGGSFFSSEQGRRVLLLRLAQSQLDALFAPEAMIAPIASAAGE